MAEPIMREFMEHIVNREIRIREEALEIPMPDCMKVLVVETLNGWRAILSLIEKHGGKDED